MLQNLLTTNKRTFKTDECEKTHENTAVNDGMKTNIKLL